MITGRGIANASEASCKASTYYWKPPGNSCIRAPRCCRGWRWRSVVIAGRWLVAKAIRFAVEQGLRAVNFNVLTERAGTDHFLQQGGLRGDTTTLFGLFAYWLVILAALIIAFNGLGLTYITDLLQRVVLFAPKVLVAMLVAVFGSYFARFVGSAVTTYCVEAQVPDADLLGKIAQYLIMAFVVMIALEPSGGGRRHRPANISGHSGRRRARAGAGVRSRRQGVGGLAARAVVAAATR